MVLIMAISSCTEPTPGKVKVEGGYIQGIVTEDMVIYKGIPYAAPPLGELRWKAPQPLIPWEGVRSATEFAPGPMQINYTTGFSEDCLYLNVWSPAKTPKDKLPVMVWIHGGGFSAGFTAEYTYDGENIARLGDVIVVSIGYRLGKLGFMALPELSAESPNGVSGNYGLLDMIQGLQWVKKNIKAFGGDPNKVTIFGESAGGIAVSMLCASPLAKGLFEGAICESGGSFGPAAKTTSSGENMKVLALAEQDGLQIAQNLGCTTLAELRALDAEKFLDRAMGGGGGWPIVDGYVIPDDQFKMYENGNFNDVNVLIGYNSDEGASFGGRGTAETHIAGVQNRYGPFADTLLAVYPLDGEKIGKTARDLSRDVSFGWHTWSWARLQSRNGQSNVYYYYFDQHPDYPEDNPRYGFGSAHADELKYVFQHLTERQNTDADKQLAEKMGYYWTNFAKYGNPNGPQEGLPQWPEFTEENPQVMYLTGPTPFVGPVPSENSLKVLDKYFEWRRNAIDGKDWGNL